MSGIREKNGRISGVAGFLRPGGLSTGTQRGLPRLGVDLSPLPQKNAFIILHAKSCILHDALLVRKLSRPRVQ